MLPLILIWYGAGGFAAVLILRELLGRLRLSRAEGRSTSGIARGQNELRAPVSGSPCFAWAVEVEAGGIRLARRTECAGFTLEPASGDDPIEIAPSFALQWHPAIEPVAVAAGPGGPALAELLADTGIARPRTAIAREWRLIDGDPCSVLRRGDEIGVIPGPARPPTTGARYRLTVATALILGVVLFAMWPMVAWALGQRPPPL